jgi:hypothetical protein
MMPSSALTSISLASTSASRSKRWHASSMIC